MRTPQWAGIRSLRHRLPALERARSVVNTRRRIRESSALDSRHGGALTCSRQRCTPCNEARARSSRAMSCDVFVIFGITGDLAKVMTFQALYRLEQRGLLDCPIVGVAVDDWTVDQLRDRAREAIITTGGQLDEAVFARLVERMSYVPGDFSDPATYERVQI